MRFFAFAFAALLCVTAAHADEDLAAEVLAEVNLARTQPRLYAQFIAERAPGWRGSEGSRAAYEAVRFLKKVRPVPALEWSDGISRAALSHVLDIGTRGARGHYGSRGESPWKRMARFGERIGYAAENISYGWRDARSIVMSLIIDDGVRSRAHRRSLFGSKFRVAGIAVGEHARAGSMCVMNFASGFVEGGAARVAVRSGLPRSRYSGMSLF